MFKFATFALCTAALTFQFCEARKSCFVNKASFTIPRQTISLFSTSTTATCKAECAINRLNWYSLVSKMNYDFTDKLIEQSSACPRRGSPEPQMRYLDSRRLLGVHLKGRPSFTWQLFVSRYIPSRCRTACNKGNKSVKIPAFPWEWGSIGFANTVALFCREGYDETTNRCNDLVGFAVVEISEGYLNSVCNARVPSF